MSHLSNLVNLKTLKISSRRLENIPWLSNCTALEELHLYGTTAIQSTNAFTPLRKLKRLTLSCCGNVTDLSGLPPLEELHFNYGTRITDIDGLLRRLHTLKTLRLSSTFLLDPRILRALLERSKPLVLFIEDSFLDDEILKRQSHAQSLSWPRRKQQIRSAIIRCVRNANIKMSVSNYMSV